MPSGGRERESRRASSSIRCGPLLSQRLERFLHFLAEFDALLPMQPRQPVVPAMPNRSTSCRVHCTAFPVGGIAARQIDNTSSDAGHEMRDLTEVTGPTVVMSTPRYSAGTVSLHVDGFLGSLATAILGYGYLMPAGGCGRPSSRQTHTPMTDSVVSPQTDRVGALGAVLAKSVT
jgi:hypothetical protein